MKVSAEHSTFRRALHQFAELGVRTLAGMATASIAVVLMLVSTEVGISLAFVGLGFAIVSAVLIHPHGSV